MQESHTPLRGNATGRRLLTNFLISEFSLIAGNLVVRVCLRESIFSTSIASLIAIATALPMLLFAITFFRTLRTDLDEMLQRVVLEGLAFAMIVYVPLAGLYVNARAAGLIGSRLDAPEIMLIPSILVAIGVMLSWSRVK